MEGFIEFDVSVDVGDARKDVSAVVDRLRPDWKDDWSIEKIVGTGNTLLKCKLLTDEKDENAILIRIFSDFAAKIYDIASYVITMRVVAALGQCAEVFGSVKNGIVYKFTPGERLYGTEWLNEENVFKAVAKELAGFHQIKPNEFLCSHNLPATISEEPFLFSRIDYFLSYIPEDLSQLGSVEGMTIRTKQELINEVEIVKKNIISANRKVVLNHGDPITGNIIYDKNIAKVTFIDWEASGFNYDSFDIASFLYLRFNIDMSDGKMTCRFSPETKERQLLFIKTYFETLRHNSPTPGEVTDKEIDEMYEHGQVMYLAILLYRAILCYRLVSITKLPFDLTSFGNDHVVEYLRRKEVTKM